MADKVRRLYVRGLSPRVGKAEITEIFQQYGKVANVTSGKAGFAFVVLSLNPLKLGNVYTTRNRSRSQCSSWKQD